LPGRETLGRFRAAHATGPPLQLQGSLPRSLRDGLRPPLTPESLRSLTGEGHGQARGLPAGRAALGTFNPSETNPPREAKVFYKSHQAVADWLWQRVEVTRD